MPCTCDRGQVLFPLAGFVNLSVNNTFLCPTSANFIDAFDGLFGVNHSFPAVGEYCDFSIDGTAGRVLLSSLQFQCHRCASGTYSLLQGVSHGEPGDANTFSCFPCPAGARCDNGTVRPTAGYWGTYAGAYTGTMIGDDGVVSMAICPGGYCCDDVQWPCTRVDACAGEMRCMCVLAMGRGCVVVATCMRRWRLAKYG